MANASTISSSDILNTQPLDSSVINDLANGILNQNRRSLAQAITLIESTREDHRKSADELIKIIMTKRKSSLRIGLSGSPGVGKSTFIESFGMLLIKSGFRVAVLAVDPSSRETGGSILGDKTRMERLTREENAYIRPSPNKMRLGGVEAHTRESILLCEAAGYDVILIETVGVGQSEIAVEEITDLFCLLIAPAAGDELQGVKRGITEIADLIIINKADGKLLPIASKTTSDYTGALRLIRKKRNTPPNFPKALMISALTGNGLETVWANIQKFSKWQVSNNIRTLKRNLQALSWFKEEVAERASKQLEKTFNLEPLKKRLENDVFSGKKSPIEGIEQFVKAMKDKLKM